MSGFVIRSSHIVDAVSPIEVVNPELDVAISGFAVDSREVDRHGMLFGAISLRESALKTETVWYKLPESKGGYYFNHHEFVESAIVRGARVILCETLPESILGDVQYIVVENVIIALGKVANYILQLANTLVVAVTGSSGKTTTVHMIYSVLRNHLSNVAKVYTYRPNPITMSLGILNAFNEIGYGGTMVLEMPTDHYGCISRLTSIAPPDIGVVLNVMEAHINVFRSIREIARAKLELVIGLKPNGIAVLNFDDDLVNLMQTHARNHKVVGFAYGAHDALVKAQFIERLPDSIRFELVYGAESVEVSLTMIGFSSVYNALAVAAVALSVGIPLQEVGNSLAVFEAMQGRMSWKRLNNGRIRIYDNSAKSNSTNLHHLIEAVKESKWTGRRILVLGDLDSDEHEQIGDAVWQNISHIFEYVVFVGLTAQKYSTCLLETTPFNPSNVLQADTQDEGAMLVIRLCDSTDEVVYMLATGKSSANIGKLIEAMQKHYD
ncbi:MAG: UDP-N-acetylmuramoyl-tripeptide--D-alanyl-D-alanine ligase [Candidatus Brocadia sp.]|nr:UDP-N-acetylmuramoyl-tripeptide--D-alanyl-D-alanine ligase [Candidatus Brocadia sp.]